MNTQDVPHTIIVPSIYDSGMILLCMPNGKRGHITIEGRRIP